MYNIHVQEYLFEQHSKSNNARVLIANLRFDIFRDKWPNMPRHQSDAQTIALYISYMRGQYTCTVIHTTVMHMYMHTV